MSLFALILAYVFGLLSPLAFLYGPDVLKLASATLAGSVTVPNIVLVPLVLNATVSGLAVLLPAMRSFSKTIKTFLKPTKTASTTFPESIVSQIRPRSTSQASLLPVVLVLACVSRLLKEAATSPPAVLAALEAAQDAQEEEDQPTRVPGAYHDHPTLNGKPSLLAIPPLVLCGLLSAAAFILGSTVSLFLLWVLTAWAWAQVYAAPLDDASAVTLVNEEVESETPPPSLPASLTSLPALSKAHSRSRLPASTCLQAGLSRGDDSSESVIFKPAPSPADLDVPPPAIPAQSLPNNRLDEDPDLTLVGDENTPSESLLSASRSALALPSPQSQTARREVSSPVGVTLHFGSVKASPLAYSWTVSTACVIPGGSKLGLDPLIPSFVPAAKKKPDTAQPTAPLSSAWSRGGCPNTGSKTPSLFNPVSCSALALPTPSPRSQNGRPEVPSPVGVGLNIGRAKAVPDPSGGSKSGLDPLVAEFIPAARPSVGKNEKPSAWSRGGCPARITAPPAPTALKASAPVFLPQADRNEIHAATTRKRGLWAPPESSGIQFRRPPPAFWAPGGRPVPIVAA